MASTKPNQQDVKRLKKFSDWEYGSQGIQQRLPYVHQHQLTTSSSPGSSYWKGWGSITGIFINSKTLKVIMFLQQNQS